MTDRDPPTSSTPSPVSATTGSELPPRLLSKLKVEVEGYEILERLGAGGQATVYRAIQKKDNRVVAIKILHFGPHANEEARARLHRETNALRALKHPNIVHAIGAGRTRSGLECLVMNYIEGRPLDALWEDGAFAAAIAPEPAARLRLFKQICETVQAAHLKGITHRDLSPSNILIDGKGRPHILDFGMASTPFDALLNPNGRNVTVTGQFIGKLKYASPEQARGAGSSNTADIRSDVYALGVMLYQILTDGAFPYEVVGNVIDVLNNIIHSKPRPPSELLAASEAPTASLANPDKLASPARSIRRNPPLVNETIEAIVLKALEKQPDLRYQSAGELAADIDHYLAGQPTSAGAWTSHRSTRFFTGHRRIAAVAALIVVPMLVIGAVMNARTLLTVLGLSTATVAVAPAPESQAEPAPNAAEFMEPMAFPESSDPLESPKLAMEPALESIADVENAHVPARLPETSAALASASAPSPASPSATAPDAQPELSNKRLDVLAEDLARVEAELQAATQQLDNADVSAPEGSSVPIDCDAFCTKIAEISTAAGVPLKFVLLSEEDRRQAKEAMSREIAGEADKDTLLAMRRSLETEQAGLWAQLTWAAFAAREIDSKPIYLYNLKSPSAADVETHGDRFAGTKRGVLDAGVKVVRTADAALRAGDETLKSATSDPDVSHLADVLGETAAKTADTIVAFREKANLAKETNLSDEHKALIDSLRTTAGNMKQAIDAAVDAQSRLDKAQGADARNPNRKRLQENLRDLFVAASQFDERLVALAMAWNAETNQESRLSPVTPMVAKAKPAKQPKLDNPKPAKPAEKGLAALFSINSEWTGTYYNESNAINGRSTTAKVLRHEGDIVVLERQTAGFARRHMYINVNGNKLQVVKDVGVSNIQESGAPPNKFMAIAISGDITDGTLTLSGTQDVYSAAGKFLNKESGKLTLQRTGDRNDAKTTADPLAAWEPRSRWVTPNRNGGINVWTVRSREGNNLEIERPSVQGKGTVVVQLLIGKSGSLSVSQVRHENTAPVLNRDWSGKGTITATSLKLTFSVESQGGRNPWERWSETLDLRPE